MVLGVWLLIVSPAEIANLLVVIGLVLLALGGLEERLFLEVIAAGSLVSLVLIIAVVRAIGGGLWLAGHTRHVHDHPVGRAWLPYVQQVGVVFDGCCSLRCLGHRGLQLAIRVLHSRW